MKTLVEIQKLNLICLIMKKKADLKRTTDVDTSNLAVKSDLRSPKAKADKVNIDKLETSAGYLSKLSNLIDDDVTKKTVYDKLVAQVNAIDTGGFVLKTQMN